jgi:hypothetical protein
MHTHTSNRYNHITVKLPPSSAVEFGTPGPLFLINAFGCRFDEVTPESLHTVDLDGNIVRKGEPIPGVKDRGALFHHCLYTATLFHSVPYCSTVLYHVPPPLVNSDVGVKSAPTLAYSHAYSHLVPPPLVNCAFDHVSCGSVPFSNSDDVVVNSLSYHVSNHAHGHVSNAQPLCVATRVCKQRHGCDLF